MEQYYHAPGKFSTMVLEVGARALTKHALNVHCGHDDFYAALDTGWTMLVSKDAQQAADQAIILRKVNELSLNPGMNIQDGMLTTHSERTYLAPEAELLREFLGAADDTIECPTPAQRELFGSKRRRVPEMMDLKNPAPARPGAEPGASHERRRRAPQQFQRAHPQIPRGRLRRIRPAHRPRLRPDPPVQVRGRRHGVRLARLRRGQHRGRLRLPARKTQREGRLHPHQRHPPLPRGRRHQRAARQEERHHPRTHRRRHGRRQPARARHPRRARQGQRGREVRRRPARRSRPRRRPASSAAATASARAISGPNTRSAPTNTPPATPAARTAPAPPAARPISPSASTIPTPSSARKRRRCCPTAPSPCGSIPSAAGA